MAFVALLASLVLAAATSAHDRRFSTDLSAALTQTSGASFVRGDLDSNRSACVPNRLVKLFRAVPGADRLVGKDRTGARGRWQVGLGASPAPGNFYAKATQRRIGPRRHRHLCRGARSNQVTVVATAPTVTILNPADGETRSSSTDIPFIGSASDPQDGELSGASIVWTSDLDGEIGTGTAFDARLSVGVHEITATATDSDGNTGTDTIGLTVTD